MKKLLICTNPLYLAGELLDYGIRLAKDLDMEIKVLHIVEGNKLGYNTMGTNTDQAVEASTYIDIHNMEREKAEKKIKTLLDENIRKIDMPPVVSIKVDPGFVKTNLPSETSNENVQLLLISNYDEENPSMIQNYVNIIEEMHCPVLVKPPNIDYKPVKKILYASVFEPGDIQALKKIAFFAGKMQAKITVLHIIENENNEEDNKLKRAGLEKIVEEKLPYKNVVIKEENMDQVSEGIIQYAEKTSADLVATLKRDKNFLEELFGSSTTKKIIKKSRLPVYVYCEK
jgi:nucleotide-binding universal stress UspA family protein